MARYFRFMDTKQWTALRGILADDMSMSAPDDVADSKPLVGADRVVRMVERVLGPAVTTHRGYLPEIEVIGPDEAHAIWAMDDLVEFADAPDNSFRGYRPLPRDLRAHRRGMEDPVPGTAASAPRTRLSDRRTSRWLRETPGMYDQAPAVHLCPCEPRGRRRSPPVEIENAWPSNPDYVIDLVPEPLTARVWYGDVLLAESTACLRVEETRHVDRLYFPEADVNWEHFEESVAHTICPFKGRSELLDADRCGSSGEERRVDLPGSVRRGGRHQGVRLLLPGTPARRTRRGMARRRRAAPRRRLPFRRGATPTIS